MLNYVDVILPLPIANLYTYEVPAKYQNLEIGTRVVVQFGPKKIYTALIHSIHQNCPQKHLAKPILEVLDQRRIVTDKQIEFWEWMSSYYSCNLGDVMNAALPSAFKLSSETVLLLEDADYDKSVLSDEEFLIVAAIEKQDKISFDEVSKILDKKRVFPIIKNLIERNIVVLQEELNDKYQPKFIRSLELVSDKKIDLSVFKNAKKQSQIFQEIYSRKQKNPDQIIEVSEIVSALNTSHATINTLVEKGFLNIEKIQKDRILEHELDSPISKDLSKVQLKSLDQIKDYFKKKNVVLFHGVTSSGKTEVYVKLIEDAIQKGQQVLYLLPEIALTTQIINRLRKYFGDQIGVFHSKFNNSERLEVWNEVLNGKRFPIVLGARSALFLPFTNLGLVIVDEEHENTFKQMNPAPRYNARDSAIKYAHMHGAKVLLGSATPSIESYYNASNAKYGLVELFERFGGVQMPEVEIEDIKYVRHRKLMKGSFSPKLLEQIGVALENKEQVILFQNRRGFAPVSECKECGWTAKCISCDVSLTFHKKIDLLKCHYCGFSENPVKRCKSCGGLEVEVKGFGTEKIEEELQPHFPEAAISRMDLDTTSRKNAHQEIIHDFENKRIDILIGTQMVTKGLDFDNVSIVGVLNADSLLNFPDFRSHERSFQLMVQVSGRAGRKKKQGKVLIQTYSKDHEIIDAVKNSDYLSMYKSELRERQLFKYPPYCKLIKIVVSHKDYNTTNQAARDLAILLRQTFSGNVLGPEYPVVSRVKNRFLKNILIKVDSENSPSKVKMHLRKLIELLNQKLEYRSVRFTIDVDPA